MVSGEIHEFDYAANGTPAFGTGDNGGFAGGMSGINRSLHMTRETVKDIAGNEIAKTEYYFNYYGQVVRERRLDGDGTWHVSDTDHNMEGKTLLTRAEDASTSGSTHYMSIGEAAYLGLGRLFVDKPIQSTQTGCGCGGAGQASDIVTNYTYGILNGDWRTQSKAPIDDLANVLVATRYFDYQEADTATAKTPLARRLFGVENPTASQVQAVADLIGFLEIPMGLGDINGDGLTNQFQGNVVKEVSPPVTSEGQSQARSRLRAYDTHGDVLYEVNEIGVRTDYTYDANGNLTERVEDAAYTGRPAALPAAVQARWTYTYDVRGNKISETNPRGVRTDYKYDAWNELVQITRAAGGRPQLRFDPFRGPTCADLRPSPTAYKLVTRNEYDANGQLIHTYTEDRGQTDGCGNEIEQRATYDILGRKTAEAQEVAEDVWTTTSYYYDALGRQVLTVYPRGQRRFHRVRQAGPRLTDQTGAYQFDDAARFGAAGHDSEYPHAKHDAHGHALDGHQSLRHARPHRVHRESG